MTDDEIRQEMDFLQKMLGTWHEQINAIANREANGAILQYPIPYENAELAQAKEKLIKKSAAVIEILQDLHRRLVSPQNEE